MTRTHFLMIHLIAKNHHRFNITCVIFHKSRTTWKLENNWFDEAKDSTLNLFPNIILTDLFPGKTSPKPNSQRKELLLLSSDE